MKVLATIARVLLGAAFVVFGMNFFIPFMPMPPMSGPPGELVGAMVKSGYLLHAAKVLEVTGGLLLLTGFMVPLGLTLLAPVIVNIVLFHVFLTPPNTWAMSLVFAGLEIFLIAAYWPNFRGLLLNSKPMASIPSPSLERVAAPAT